VEGRTRLDTPSSDAFERVARNSEAPAHLLGQGGVDEHELGTHPIEQVARMAIGGRSHALSIVARGPARISHEWGISASPVSAL
jgi:hypothetical protein